MQNKSYFFVAVLLALGHINLAHGETDLMMSRAFPSQKIYDAQGSPLRVATEDWATAASLVATNSGWSSWVVSRQQNMDKWMSVVRDRADMEAGHIFKLLDPQTNLPVTWTVDMPEPTKVGANGGDYWRAWVAYVRGRNLDNIVEAARLYKLTGRTVYRNWATEQLDFYAANYLTWPLQTWNGKARMMGQSLDEASAIPSLVDAVRLLASDVTAQRKKEWQDKLFTPIAQNLIDFNQGVNNIAVWHASAIGLVALEFNDATLLNAALNGDKGLNTLLNKGITKDYIWYEGAFSYNNYVVAAMIPLFKYASVKGKSALLKTPMLMAQNMLLSPAQFQFDNGYLPTVGDTRGQIKAIDLGALQTAARVLPTITGITEANRVKNWDSLLDPLKSTTTAPLPAPSITSKVFEGSRVAILKNATWQAFVHYGQLTYAHAQAEVPNYELYAGNTKISTDQGTIDYASPFHERYFRRAVAHNVPLIDGEGQELDKGTWLEGFLERFNPKQPSISVTQPAYQKGVNVGRQITLQGNIFMDTTRINVASGTKRRLGVVFNTDCQFDTTGGLAGLTPTSAPLGTGFDYWQSVLKGSAPTQWATTLDCSGEKFNFQVTASKPHQLYRAVAPATPMPKTRNAIYMEMQDSEATFEVKITASNR